MVRARDDRWAANMFHLNLIDSKGSEEAPRTFGRPHVANLQEDIAKKDINSMDGSVGFMVSIIRRNNHIEEHTFI